MENRWRILRLKNLMGLLILLSVASSCSDEINKKNVYVMDTDYGNIYVEIYPDKAPNTCAAFMKNVADSIFDNSSFYRIVKSENAPPKYDNGVIQGGIYESDITLKKALPFILHEPPSITGISHEAGTISMARLAPGTAQSEFFICVGNQQQFDSSRSGNPDGLGYAAFGSVIKGYSVVKKIHQQKNIADAFVRSVKINSIRKL
jgi:peptidyl-prolyl cis-trans isomerase A (cyclophilin A)